MNSEEEGRQTITITFVGSPRFKQALVNAVAELLNSEYFMSEVAKPGCGFTFTSTIEPSEDYS